MDGTGALKRKVIGAITTNETSFFRDTAPFEMLRHKILPDLGGCSARQLGKDRLITLRIWSAACSTGQEVYSTAIVCKRCCRTPAKYDVRILGTDISDKVLAHASAGKYTKLEMDRGISAGQGGRLLPGDGAEFQSARFFASAGHLQGHQSTRTSRLPDQVRHHLLSQRGHLFLRHRQGGDFTEAFRACSPPTAVSLLARPNPLPASVSPLRTEALHALSLLPASSQRKASHDWGRHRLSTQDRRPI
jgi:hypothetical protein